MSIFSDIIDNRHLNLKDEILTKLDGSDKIKFAVGYLYLSGFYQIADKLENLKGARLLIGSNINRNLLEALAESVAGEEELKYLKKMIIDGTRNWSIYTIKKTWANRFNQKKINDIRLILFVERFLNKI